MTRPMTITDYDAHLRAMAQRIRGLMYDRFQNGDSFRVDDLRIVNAHCCYCEHNQFQDNEERGYYPEMRLCLGDAEVCPEIDDADVHRAAVVQLEAQGILHPHAEVCNAAI